jgi:hypothetical protein
MQADGKVGLVSRGDAGIGCAVIAARGQDGAVGGAVLL